MCRLCGGPRPRFKHYCPPCLRIVTRERQRRYDLTRRRCINCGRERQRWMSFCNDCRRLARQIVLGRERPGAHQMARHCHCCGRGQVGGRGRMYCPPCGKQLRREQQRDSARRRRATVKRLAA